MNDCEKKLEEATTLLKRLVGARFGKQIAEVQVDALTFLFPETYPNRTGLPVIEFHGQGYPFHGYADGDGIDHDNPIILNGIFTVNPHVVTSNQDAIIVNDNGRNYALFL